jgi:transposase
MPHFLTDEQVTILKQAHRTIKDKKLADRIKAVLSLNAGYEYSHVAKILLLDEVTLRRYVKHYQDKGLNGLLEYRYTGGQAKLTLDQQEKLSQHLEKCTYLTAQSVIHYVKDQYQIQYSLEGITQLLHRLGFSYKKPKIVPGKANPLKQAAFLSTYAQIKSEAQPEDHIYFADAVHPTHNTHTRYGWIKKGQDKNLPANSGRKRLNLNGALTLKGKTAVVLPEETINAYAMIRLGATLLKQHSTGKIYLILDNARYNHAKKFKAWREKHGRLKVIFLSPYSPQFNMIERLWRFMYQHILANKYFPTFTEFQATVMDFFNHLDRYRSQLDTLLTDNFQTIPALQLQT